jgi:hypothetical protein
MQRTARPRIRQFVIALHRVFLLLVNCELTFVVDHEEDLDFLELGYRRLIG